MPPKKKAAAATKRKAPAAKGGAGGKKAKTAAAAAEADVATVSDAIQKLKEADEVKVRKAKPDAMYTNGKPDGMCRIGKHSIVYLCYDCVLNQTSIGHNNNKYYILQVLLHNGHFYSWYRWGRVGESGQSSLIGPMGSDSAIKDFEKKFRDKTKNNWADRASFIAFPGKYTMLEMDGAEDNGDNKEKRQHPSEALVTLLPQKAAAATKRKAPAAKGGAGGKKAKTTAAAAEADVATVSDAIQKLKEADKVKVRKAKPDAMCTLGTNCIVHLDYDCMLNQTNIGHNNNKYYILQVLLHNGHYYTWYRWGRVGEPGQSSLKGPMGAEVAIKDFEKKFKDKTKNNWADHASFTALPGKYTMLEMDDEEDNEDDHEKMAKLDELDGVKRVTADCTLDKPTQDLVKLLFDTNMFREAMKDLEIDVKKMPLGKLSKSQIAKGFEVLEEIETALKNNTEGSALDQLSSRFYTLIPHNFGRERPPIISDEEGLRKKMDMLMVLADIELAQSMQKSKVPSITKDKMKIPHPLDENYTMLQCGLSLMNKKDKEFKMLEKYLQSTQRAVGQRKILDVWKVDRHNEKYRFAAHDKIENRRLLWHGTNIAVVAAILKSGLRIMPHSGGRVGRGIYFASESCKSAAYVRPTEGGTGIMFLNEVVLGNEHHIDRSDSSLTAAPRGYDSIVAKGHTEPDPKQDVSFTIDGHEVKVPQGRPIPVREYRHSRFYKSEYLIYKESQNRIRYLLKMQF